MLILFRRAQFAWLIADGDMHLKNLALLKIAEPGAPQFRDVRMAPLHDAVTTRVFPRLDNDRMALKLNGKDDRLTRADFRALRATMGLKAGDAEEAIDTACGRVGEAIEGLRLPDIPGYDRQSALMRDRMFDIVRARLATVV